jgi:NAD(P)-dependent dehydrogenase (short-subunit alcohol dehydrogenase family)
MDFSGRVALITGAGKGLGRCFARALAQRGAAVVVNNRRRAGQDTAGDLAEQLRSEGHRAAPDRESVEQPGAADRMVAAAVDRFGRLDIVISNAAVAERGRFHDAPFESFRTVIEIDLMAPAALARAALPVMREAGWGRLLFVTSGAGMYGEFGVASYSTAKAGLRGLARTITLENAHAGIFAHELAPYALTQMTEGFVDDATARRMDPALVVPGALWLVSDAAPQQTTTLVAGGGRFRRAEVMEASTLSFAAPPSDDEFLAATPRLLHDERWRTFPDGMQSFRNLIDTEPEGAG